MNYNFDEIINRKNNGSVKHNSHLMMGVPEDALPLWVADMDFRTAPAVTEALVKGVEHSIFGYVGCSDSYYDAVRNWFKTRHSFDAKREWIIHNLNVLEPVATAIRTFTNEGDGILLQTPVYHLFSRFINANGRKVIESPLVLEGGKYSIDFSGFEQKIVDNHIKLFVICNPHNPCGRVWTRDELQKLGDICLKHNVLVISDEIHCDLVYKPHKHTNFATLGEKYANNCIICTAPSKTFNLASMTVANTFIPNDDLREAYLKEDAKSGVSGVVTTFGALACEAAYKGGGEWLNALLCYLQDTINYVDGFLKQNLPEVKLIMPDATYLLWLDFRALKMPESELNDIILNKAKLWLNMGSIYGAGGEGFMRMNVATPRSNVVAALDMLKKALG